jgi:hypothetical protein
VGDKIGTGIDGLGVGNGNGIDVSEGEGVAVAPPDGGGVPVGRTRWIPDREADGRGTGRLTPEPPAATAVGLGEGLGEGSTFGDAVGCSPMIVCSRNAPPLLGRLTLP